MSREQICPQRRLILTMRTYCLWITNKSPIPPHLYLQLWVCGHSSTWFNFPGLVLFATQELLFDYAYWLLFLISSVFSFFSLSCGILWECPSLRTLYLVGYHTTQDFIDNLRGRGSCQEKGSLAPQLLPGNDHPLPALAMGSSRALCSRPPSSFLGNHWDYLLSSISIAVPGPIHKTLLRLPVITL